MGNFPSGTLICNMYVAFKLLFACDYITERLLFHITSLLLRSRYFAGSGSVAYEIIRHQDLLMIPLQVYLEI